MAKINMSFQVLTTTFVFILGSFPCFSIPNAAGCYEPDKNTITIDASLSPEEFKRVVLHEVAHYLYRNEFDTQQLFFSIPKAASNLVQDEPKEKMADWFAYYISTYPWQNIEQNNIIIQKKHQIFDKKSLEKYFESEIDRLPDGRILLKDATQIQPETTKTVYLQYKNNLSCNNILTLHQPILEQKIKLSEQQKSFFMRKINQ